MSDPQAYDEGWDDGRDHWKGIFEPRIAELEAELAEAQEQVHIANTFNEVGNKTISILKAERDRLREALQEIIRAAQRTSCMSTMQPYWDFVDVATLIAKQALKGDSDE